MDKSQLRTRVKWVTRVDGLRQTVTVVVSRGV